MSSSIKGFLPKNVVFLHMFFFYQRLKESKAIFHQRLSSIKGRFPSKVIFHQKLSPIKGCLPPKVVFHQRLSSIKACVSSTIVFHQLTIYVFKLSVIKKVYKHISKISVTYRKQFCIGYLYGVFGLSVKLRLIAIKLS